MTVPTDELVTPLAVKAEQIQTLAQCVTAFAERGQPGDDHKAETIALLIHELSDDLGELALRLTDHWAEGEEA